MWLLSVSLYVGFCNFLCAIFIYTQALAVYMCMATSAGGQGGSKLQFDHRKRCTVYGNILQALLHGTGGESQRQFARAVNNILGKKELLERLTAAQTAIWRGEGEGVKGLPTSRKQAAAKLSKYVWSSARVVSVCARVYLRQSPYNKTRV